MSQGTPGTADVTPDQARALVRTMLVIRRVEEAMIGLYRRNLIPGFIHPAIGEEAIHAGVALHLGPRDHVVGSHRNHGTVLAKGADPGRMLAEVLGKAGGLLGGRGGSLHLGDWAVGCLPASPLVGGGIGTMTGLALAHQLAGDGGVGVCFFGDGAANRGSYAEALNMAAIWKLPVIYALIDNGWAISVAREAASGGDLVTRARGYGVSAERVDGKDVLACAHAAAVAVARARAGDGPTVLVFDCPRAYGHEEGDSQEYRSREEIERSIARDPLSIGTATLVAAGALAPGDFERIDLEVQADVAAAVTFALESPMPDPEQAFHHVRPSESWGDRA